MTDKTKRYLQNLIILYQQLVVAGEALQILVLHLVQSLHLQQLNLHLTEVLSC